MQKNLIALAVAGALFAPLAAQAETTVYGQAHLDVRVSDNDADSWTNVNSNSSRVGVKGSEDLGNGMKAVFQMEFGVNMAEGGGFSGRNQFVGLAGGFGTVLVGRHDTPYKLATANLDVFADTIADANNVLGINGALDTREDNVIAYATPDMGGLSALVAYVPDEDETNDLDEDKASFNVKYAAGPLFAGLGYVQANGVPVAAARTLEPALAAGGITNFDAEGIRAGVGYNAGVFSVGFVYDTVNIEDVVTGADADVENMYLSGAFKFGDNALKAAYGTMGGDLDDFDGGADWYAAGVSHSFSKATEAYVLYTAMNNDDAGDFALGGFSGPGEPFQAGAGNDATAFAVGMVHKF